MLMKRGEFDLSWEAIMILIILVIVAFAIGTIAFQAGLYG